MTGGGSDGDGTDTDGEEDDRGPEGGTDGAADVLADELLDGSHRALARAITIIENRSPGYRELVSRLHRHAGGAEVVGVTGSPGAGKSTLVDRLAAAYRDRGLTVGVVAIDPSSPYTGGAVLGDRIRMASNAGDMDVFVRSMSARGSLGGLSTATADAVTALDAFGKDRIVVETVGAGQNEVDIVRTADTVAVLVPPGSGDDVQMLKAGILEIADLFVVNKADLEGADRTVQELREMLEHRTSGLAGGAGHHGPAPEPTAGGGSRDGGPGDSDGDDSDDGSVVESGDGDGDEWAPPIVETVANRGEGIDDVLDALAAHRSHLDGARLAERERRRQAEAIRRLLREDVNDLLEGEIERRGGLDEYVERVRAHETDPYTVADELLTPIRECLDRERAGDGR